MSVTVIIDGGIPDNGMLADILSLTVFVLGTKKGIDLINSMPNVSCEITTTDFKIYTSSKFKDKFSDLNKDFKFAKLVNMLKQHFNELYKCNNILNSTQNIHIFVTRL